MEYETSKIGSIAWLPVQSSYPRLIAAEIKKNTEKEYRDQEEFRNFINEMYSSILFEFEEPSSTLDFELIDLILENSWIPMYMLESESKQEDIIIEESLNYFVVMKYKKFEFVNSIFFQKYKKELRYYVYFESEQYDSNIMDQLISNELDILDSYPDLHFDFIYCPSKIEKGTCLLGEYIQKIYERI